MGEKGAEIQAAFQACDASGAGFVTYDDLQNCLSKCGLELNDQALITIMRRWDLNKDGTIAYKEFLTNL